jgi:hypothetical protein
MGAFSRQRRRRGRSTASWEAGKPWQRGREIGEDKQGKRNVWAVGEKSEGDKVVYGAGSFSRHATLSIRMTRCVIYPRVRLSFSFPLTLFIDLARSNARVNVLVVLNTAPVKTNSSDEIRGRIRREIIF